MQRLCSLIVAVLILWIGIPSAFSQSVEIQNNAVAEPPQQPLKPSTSKRLVQGKSIVTNLNFRGADNETNHLIDVLPLFTLKNDSVIQPIDLSADYPGMSLTAWKVNLPKEGLTTGIKHAYGFVPHHHGIGVAPDFVLILVDNPVNMRYRATKIWVDLNHNLDLTDDGPAQWY
ncbi:MAG: hypothetical protein EBR94_11430, partial [Bacteroidetes bacterium]|nr:hypothetical protein [Bacteroidota bacterium]